MTDVLNDGHDYWMIHRRKDTGAVDIKRIRLEDSNRWNPFGEVAAGELPIPAIAVGEAVMALIPDGSKIEGYEFDNYCDNVEKEWEQVSVRLEPIEPEELVGVEFLASLASGTMWREFNDRTGFIVFENGLHWLSGSVWRWDGTTTTPSGYSDNDLDWRSCDMATKACAENIKPWEPDNE